MNTAENVSGLVEEYRVLLEGLDGDSSGDIEKALIRDGEWTPEAALHLVGEGTGSHLQLYNYPQNCGRGVEIYDP